ncbi:MAG: response regulator [Gammaproteobacteria bacterium]|nr:response regulator [Gammaproteobacteria bacterium]MBU1654668.1 response regulator [Gammaproteobacteria bacterium]MBU1961391.1 response regulator [Gammaproteobacteria bacterium]
MIKVLVVDDHELVRTGFCRILETSDEFRVVGEASSGEDALRLADALHPAVVLMDVFMPGMGGIEATSKLIEKHPDIKVIALSMHFEAPFPCQMNEAGALGYLTKRCSAEELFQSIRTVAKGQPYLSMDLARSLSLASMGGRDEGSPLLCLSQRELQVLMMIVRGARTQDVADTLFLSPKTISTYRQRLFEKLGVKTDVEMTHLALRHGILKQAPPVTGA